MFAEWLALLIGIGAAHADATPLILPDRDVAITYEFSAPGRATQGYRLQYDAADERVRIDNPAQGTYFLIDLPAGSAKLVVPQLNSVVDAPDISGLTQQITDAGQHARFTPLGAARYAGLACQNWLILGPQGTATACLTADGVALHFDGRNAHGSGSATATAVTYGSQPVSAFAPPQGYNAVTLSPGLLQQLITGGSP